MSTFWFSFCDPDAPKGQQFLGVAIVSGESFYAALSEARLLGCNPGGEVAGTELDGPPVPEDYFNRLLSKADIAKLEEVMKERMPEPPSRLITDTALN